MKLPGWTAVRLLVREAIHKANNISWPEDYEVIDKVFAVVPEIQHEHELGYSQWNELKLSAKIALIEECRSQKPEWWLALEGY